jgi:hypothetical protein
VTVNGSPTVMLGTALRTRCSVAGCLSAQIVAGRESTAMSRSGAPTPIGPTVVACPVERFTA